jgi:hypothetical protein
VLTRLKNYLVDLYQREPARANAAIVAGIVAAAGAVGVVLSAPVILTVVVLAAPFVVAELTRPRVTPEVAVREQLREQAQASYGAGLVAGVQGAQPAELRGDPRLQ